MPDDRETAPGGTSGAGLAAIPRGAWALGIVSLLMDLSSEAIHSLLPIFLVSVLGASATALGLLEGVAEAAVLMTKMASGALSDRLGKRKLLAAVGYGIAAATKPFFALAASVAVVFAARLVDRVGKGIREAPRDALLADLTPERVRGASYGLRQSLDTVGALLGPLAAMLVMLLSGGAIRLVFWIAALPAAASIVVLLAFVREPAAAPKPMRERPRLSRAEIRRFPASFWSVVLVGAVLTLARFSEAFLVLRAGELGIAATYVPLAMAVMNVAYAVSAYPAGRLSDRIDRRIVLCVGAGLLVAADLVLARSATVAGLAVGAVLWGLHLGSSQGLLAALVADAAPADRRGTAFGMFNLVSGAMLLIAGVLAGELWDRIGAPATFYAGAIFASLALLGLLMQLRRGA